MQGRMVLLCMDTNLTLRALINSELPLSLGGSGDNNPAVNHQHFFIFVSDVNCVEGCAKG